MSLEQIKCTRCKNDMPKLRLDNYVYDFCVECSESGNKVKAKHGVPVMMGEGDHTWVETIIMDEEQYSVYQHNEKALKNLGKTNKAEMLNMDTDGKNLYGPVTIIDTKG